MLILKLMFGNQLNDLHLGEFDIVARKRQKPRPLSNVLLQFHY